MPHPWPKRRAQAALVLLLALLPCQPLAAESNSEIEALREDLKELRRRDAEREKKLESLQKQLDQLQRAQPVAVPAKQPAAASTPAANDAAAAALDQALAETTPIPGQNVPPPPPDLWARQIGGGKLRLLDISFDTLVAGGTSTAGDHEIATLQGGGHDPDQRGFTLQQAELSFLGAVDPYLSGEAHVVFTTHGVELEEAFMTTSSLPYGLQIEAGHFLTEFGQINPTHPHAWDWIDQPVVNTRMFGGDGLRAPGVRVGWLTPLPWFSEVHFGLQNADEGDTTSSFMGEDGVGGRPLIERSVSSLKDLLYLARWENFLNLSDELGTKLGVSGVYGPNNTGSDADTIIYGADWKLRWQPHDNFRGWPFFLWQSEVMKRDYTASPYSGTASSPALERDILRDWGLYTQALYGFHYGWAAGVRFDYASGSGQSLASLSGASARGREDDSLRDDRYRVSPLLTWHPSEFSRLRLQYNYDNARHLSERDAHSVWLGAEILYGMHPAHKY